ncbi:hypothetical protein Ddye_023833 [Dipteronia dyeriana]|uniref:RNase H type-1 domain-containing protein n=1 Tax=Dipteronia dyeriana TaxID=168575 RepID=A0AAD9TUL6_9ROSI|nr:hypothetical protein Ddye_023833 [Dipteronia dyeriana]
MLGLVEDPMSLEASLFSSPQSSSTTALTYGKGTVSSNSKGCSLGNELKTISSFGDQLVTIGGRVVLSSGDRPWKLDDLKGIGDFRGLETYVFRERLFPGVPLRLDKATIDGDFGHYARVLVDVDMSALVSSSVILERDGIHSSFISVEFYLTITLSNLSSESLSTVVGSIPIPLSDAYNVQQGVPSQSLGVGVLAASFGLTIQDDKLLSDSHAKLRFTADSSWAKQVEIEDLDSDDTQVVLCHEQHLTVSISIGFVMHWYTFVYASTSASVRHVLLHSLRKMASSFSSSWLVVGDFIAVLGAHECLGSRSPTRGSCEDFKSMIEDYNLIGVWSHGAHFTWVKSRSSCTRVERRVWSIPSIGRPPQKSTELRFVQSQMSDLGFSEELFLTESCIHHDLDVLLRRFYMDLFSSDSAQIDENLSIADDIVPSLVSLEENSLLVVIPSVDVIHDVVFAMDALLAPRPDGFSGRLFQHCWEIVGRDVILAVQDFFHSGVVAPGLNSNFIVLLPKMKDSIMVDQFRPIALINFLFKISSKILADRGKPRKAIWMPIADKILSKFAKGNGILDSCRNLKEVTSPLPSGFLLGLTMWSTLTMVPWWRDIWFRYIPPSRSALTWWLLLDRVPTTIICVFAFEAELLTTSLAINYAWNLGWHRIWLEFDSSYVVQLLSVRSDQVTWRVRQACQCCLHQISHMEFQVSHIFREGNQVADDLSKHALGLSSDSWWYSTPSLCSSLVGYDCMGRESLGFSSFVFLVWLACLWFFGAASSSL